MSTSRIGHLSFVVVHHPASDAVNLSLHDHTKPGAPYPPYDFWLDYPSGAVVVGRPLTVRGAHVIPTKPEGKAVTNGTAIGVAIEGDFSNEIFPILPSPSQIEKAAALIGRLCREHGIHPYSRQEALEKGTGVVAHCDVTATLCPGKYLLKYWPVLMGKIKYYYNTTTVTP